MTARLIPKNVVELRASDRNGSLIAALKRGEAHAASELFDRHVRDVERLLVRMLGYDRELSDLIQEVFLRALEGIDRVRDDAIPGAWIRGITINTARETMRTRTRKRWLVLNREPELPEVPAHDPDVSDREAHAHLRGVLGQLSPDLRTVFVLRQLEDMTVREIAEACDISTSTVKRRLDKATKRVMLLANRDAVLAERMAGR